MKITPWDGKPITAPGAYSGVPMDVYHGANLCQGASVSSSGLRTIFAESPAHYWMTSPYNPERIEEGEKEFFALGRAAHHLLLGEGEFRKLFAVRPDKWDSWRTNDAKAWRAEQIAAGLTVLEPKHLDIIRGMAKSLAAHPLVQADILAGQIETTLVWRSEHPGIWLKARPDAVPGASGDFVDLKTTTSVATPELRRAIAEHNYHMQAAMVGMGAREALKIEMQSFSLVFVEKKPPFCVRIVTLKEQDIARGERQVRAAAAMFARCMGTGEWPGPGGTQHDAEYVELPAWAQSQIDDRLAQFEQEGTAA